MPENDDAYSGSEYGKLSQNSLWNARYHFVVAVALIARICVEHHMEREIAYTLSDVFVQKIDDCKTVAEIAALHNIMVRDFTKRMQLLQKAAYSMHVARASRSTAVIFPHCSGRKPESHFTTISLRKKSMPQLR